VYPTSGQTDRQTDGQFASIVGERFVVHMPLDVGVVTSSWSAWQHAGPVAAVFGWCSCLSSSERRENDRRQVAHW